MATVQDIIDSSRYDLDDFGHQSFDDTQLLNYFNRMLKILDDVLIQLDADYTLTSSRITLTGGYNTVAHPTGTDKVRWVYHNTEPWTKEFLDQVMYRYQLNRGTSDASTITGISGQVISDNTQAWETNQYAGSYFKFLDGTLEGNSYEISSNDATNMVLDTDVETLGGAVSDMYTVPTIGRPKYWSLQNNKLYFNIDSDQDYYLDIYYHKKSGTLAATDSTPYNGVFDEYLREALIGMARKARNKKITPTDQQFYNMFKEVAERNVIGRNVRRKPYYIDF